MPTRRLEERDVCFFPSSRKAKRSAAEGQIKISFVAISKYWQTLYQQKILRTFT